jgi:hypothetical protein
MGSAARADAHRVFGTAPRHGLLYPALIENRLSVNVSGWPPVEQISKP